MDSNHVAVALAIAMFFQPLSQAFGQESTPRPAKVFTVEATSTELRRTYPAIVMPSAEVELSFRVSGRV
ncbi:MAG: hypothetical protein AAFV38_05380, partial [Pseudomonadota bacterium]